MAKKYLYFIIVIQFIVISVCGWLYFNGTADGEFEQNYQNAQSRIAGLEEQLEQSRRDITELRTENQRIREYAEAVDGDRIKLAEINRQLEIFLGQLRADNKQLTRAVRESRLRTDIITRGLEDLESLLQQIEGQDG